MSDGADDTVTILNADWDTNTGGTKPTIALVENYKRVDLGGNQDVVLVYQSPANVTPIGLGYGREQQIQSISIDIRTSTSKTRLLEIKEEVKRIVHINKTKDANGTHDLIVLEKLTNLNNKTIKLWREIVEVSIRDYSKAVPD